MATGEDTVGRQVQIKIDGAIFAEFEEISIDDTREVVRRPKFGTPYANRTPGDIECSGRMRHPAFGYDDFVDFLRSGSSFQIDYERISDSKAYTITDCYCTNRTTGGSAGNNVQNEEISFSGKESTENL
jgi:hypothetical protein